jgi:hypothetical protein
MPDVVWRKALVEISRLHLQRVDIKIGHEYVARGSNCLWLVPRIRPAAMGKLIPLPSEA